MYLSKLQAISYYKRDQFRIPIQFKYQLRISKLENKWVISIIKGGMIQRLHTFCIRFMNLLQFLRIPNDLD